MPASRHGLLRCVDHLGRGDNFASGKAFTSGSQAEIEIRIAGGNDNAAQFLTALRIISDQLFAIFTLNCASNSTASCGPEASVEFTAKIPLSCGLWVCNVKGAQTQRELNSAVATQGRIISCWFLCRLLNNAILRIS